MRKQTKFEGKFTKHVTGGNAVLLLPNLTTRGRTVSVGEKMNFSTPSPRRALKPGCTRRVRNKNKKKVGEVILEIGQLKQTC